VNAANATQSTARQDHARHSDSRRRLRIGMVAPPWFDVPPRGYGGTEAVVASLVDGLVARGHEVTLVASGTTGTKATRQITVYEQPPVELLGVSVMPEVIVAAEAARAFEEADVDLVHDHTLAGPLLAGGRSVPTITTMHGPVSGENFDYFERLGDRVGIVAISEAQRISAPGLNFVGTVHNAIDVPSFPYVADKDDYLLWVGRFTPDKGPDLAIEAARRFGRRIVLAGKLNEKPEREYFDAAVKPLLGPDAEYVGEADALLKRELFSHAACLLFPITWDEPFGMVMVEAMACGTPVVATRRGSVPEVVDHGHTGIIVDDPSALPRAIGRALELDPARCRSWVEARFDLPIMAAGYERIYRNVLDAAAGIHGGVTDIAGDITAA
jgi:glycosyltransferase involved in cell wall biosynthesis